MSYSQQKILAIVLTIVAGAITLVQAGNADVLGLTPRVLAWLGVLSGVIGIGLGFLPSVRGMGSDPGFLANRIMDLTPVQRRELREMVDRKHAEQEQTS